MDETGLAFNPFLPSWLVLAGAALLVVLCVVAYRRTTRPVSTRFKLLLLALRCAAVAALVLCLMRPSLETVHHELSKRPVVLLVDVSDSMARIDDTPDNISRLRAVERFLEEHGDRLEELKRDYELVRLQFAKGLLHGRPAESETRYSAYGRALQEAFAEAADSRADAVVLFGDGSHNLGADPVDSAASLSERGVPVYTVGVGQDVASAELRDVKVLDLEAPPNAYLFTTFPVRTQLLFRGTQGRHVPVQLRFGGEVVEQKTVRISHREETVPMVFEVTPEQEGEFKLTVNVPPLEGELLSTNNYRGTFVKVVAEGARVGYFDTLRPESKFVARALSGAEQLRVRRVLVLPGRRVEPATADPSRFDVVMLGDLKSSAVPGSVLLGIKRAVQEEGKGLIVLVGRRSGGRGGVLQPPIAELLPVRVQTGVASAQGQRRFRPAPGAAMHPALALRDTAAASRRAWQELPALAGAITRVEPKRGARVLASDQEGNPLLVVHRSGAGRVACVMADTTFRWYFTRRETQDDHRRFWRQLALWTARVQEQKEERLRVRLSRQRLLVDETVQITVSLTDSEGEPIRDAELKLQVKGPGERSVEPSYAFSREEGSYVAEYAPPEAGDYSVSATARRADRQIGADRARFHASSTNPELEEPVADMRLLRRISAVTRDAGGRYYHYLQAEGLFDELKERGGPLKLTTRRRNDVWDDWYAFALLAALTAAEWGLRKRKGLL
ncbi:MAG: VWA domain-containing protein [Planctomycetota bacterium]